MERPQRRIPASPARPPAVRAAGGTPAGGHSTHHRRARACRHRAERAGEPPGTSPDRARRRPRGAGGDRRRAVARDGGGSPRHPQGGRGLRPARSGSPPAAARADDRRCRRAPRAHHGGDRAALPCGRRLTTARPRGGVEWRARRRPGERRRAGQCRVRHLHLGFDRRAQGGGDLPSSGGEPTRLSRRDRPHGAGAAAPEDDDQLRRLDPRALRAARVAERHGAGAPGRPAGRALPAAGDRR